MDYGLGLCAVMAVVAHLCRRYGVLAVVAGPVRSKLGGVDGVH